MIVNFNDVFLAKNDPNRIKWTFVAGETATRPDPNHPENDLQPNQWIDTLWTASKGVNTAVDTTPKQWTLAAWPGTGVTVAQDSIEDIFLVCRYQIS